MRSSMYAFRFVFILLCSLSLGASAGSISFRLSLQSQQLTLSNAGNSTAFYPTVFTIEADKWTPLFPPIGARTQTQLAPGESAEFVWPVSQAKNKGDRLIDIRPYLVRYFDQAGVGFSRIFFFNPPPDASSKLQVRRLDRTIEIMRPESDTVRSTWVLWARQGGIADIGAGFAVEAVRPSAKRIDWSQGASSVLVYTGPVHESITLVHATPQGYRLQIAKLEDEIDMRQRSRWLDWGALFYALAFCLFAAAIGLLAKSRSLVKIPTRRT